MSSRAAYDPQVVTDEWRSRTEDRLDRLEISARELAQRLSDRGTPATGQAVRDLLGGARRTSSLVGAIDELLDSLDGAGPAASTPPLAVDREKARVDAAWPRLDVRARRTVAELVDGLVRGGKV